MTGPKSFCNADPRLGTYAIDVFSPLDPILQEARARTLGASLPDIQVDPMDGLHLEVLVRACGARKVVEIGTLGGYSGICIARALPEDGRLYTCEISQRHAAVARQNFEAAGVADKVEILVGPASSTLPELAAQGPFDLVFVDAEKTGYPFYARWAESHLRVGGTLVADNAFAWGLVLQKRIENPDHALAAEAMREFNAYVAASPRFRATIFPTGEGLVVAVKVR